MKKILPIAAAVVLLSGCTSMRETFGYAEPVSFSQLTPAAQQTVRRELGDQQIFKIDKETKYGKDSYRVEVAQRGFNPVLWVNADGTILKEDAKVAQGRINEAAGAQAPSKSSSSSENLNR